MAHHKKDRRESHPLRTDRPKAIKWPGGTSQARRRTDAELAQEAAACEAVSDALEWLGTVEGVDGAPSPDWLRTRASWRLLLAERR